jgi:hypothetical protein
MSEVLELVLDLICGLLDVWLGDFEWPDTLASRVFWSVILVLLGGLIWWELR